MRVAVGRENILRAYERVRRNKGAPGVDGMTVAELGPWLKEHWRSVRQALLDGLYLPQPVRAVEIPKASGGTRLLGIPTVLDRLIQQALLQVLQPLFEPVFSDSSYGFRPGRSAAQAVSAARAFVQSGKRWVVDLDLEKFFDRVNHDILMAQVALRVTDPCVLKLIRRYLEAGLLSEGVVIAREEGTPQGGPLSPLLSNVLLSELDDELERRKLAFCRYADDCNVYVASESAAAHAMQEMSAFLEEKLRLKVNRAKSACARPWRRKFLGYSLWPGREIRLRIAPDSLRRLKDKVRELTLAGRGRSLAQTIERLTPLLRGWMNYFRHAQVLSPLKELDGWIRRRLRCLLWRQLKRNWTRYKALRRQGLAEERARRSAFNQRGPWWNAGRSHMHLAFPGGYFESLGLVSLVQLHQGFQR